MAKKQYASGRSRQRAERAKRTQARNVVTMNKASEKSAKETARKTAARRPDPPKGTRVKTSQRPKDDFPGLVGSKPRPKPKRSYPKDVTKRDSPSPKRKYPTRQDGKRKNVASATSKKITKPKKRSVVDNLIDGLTTSLAPVPKAIGKGVKKHWIDARPLTKYLESRKNKK